MEIDYKELNQDEFLLHYSQEPINLPVAFNKQLPYQQLSWRRFEQLTLSYARHKYGNENCTAYGVPGQNQEGLDILVNTPGGKYILIQCKRVNEFKGTDLKNAVLEFRKGKWKARCREFVLFSSNELIEKSFVDQFEIEKSELYLDEIKLSKLGAGEIDEELKTLPSIVDDFFGRPWVEHIVRPTERDLYLNKIKPIPAIRIYEEVPNYIERKLPNPFKTISHHGMVSVKSQLLLEIIMETNADQKPAKLVIKADAALGKSKELAQLAHRTSVLNNGLFPVIVNLKIYNGDLNKLITTFFKSWEQIPVKRLLLLLDGLDEVPRKYLEQFNEEFNLLLQSLSQANIVATARSNFFSEVIGSGIDDQSKLNTIYLQPLSSWDIREITSKFITDPLAENEFHHKCRSAKVDELLPNPFYLNNLLSLFASETIAFPVNRAEAMRKIIQLKQENDRVKFNQDLPDKAYYLAAKKLAVFLTLTGQNSLPVRDLDKITPIDIDNLKRCSLFRVEQIEEQYNLFFEHNSFQEFLAAEYLSLCGEDELNNLLFHQPKFEVLKPRLINTTNYLFTLLDPKSAIYCWFFNKLQLYNNELLLKFETDKIPTAIRLNIYQSIIEKGKQQGIYYLRSNYTALELNRFIQFSHEGLSYLIRELEMPTTNSLHIQSIYELILLFQRDYVAGPLRAALLKVIKKQLQNASLSPEIHNIAIDCLSLHQYATDELIIFIQKKCKHIDNRMVRGALLKLISNSEFDTFFDYILKSAPLIFPKGITTRAGLERDFMSAVIKFVTPENVVSTLEYIALEINIFINVLDNFFDHEKPLLIDQLYEKLADYSIADDHVYTAFINVIIACYEENMDFKWGNPETFFTKTGTRRRAFLMLITDEDELGFRFNLTSQLASEAVLDDLIDLYRNGSIKPGIIRRASSLLHYNKLFDLHTYFRDKIIAEFDIFSIPEPGPDWVKIDAERQLRDFELIRNRSLFLAEAQKLYGFTSTIKDFEALTGWHELQWSEKKKIRTAIDSTIIIHTIEVNKIKGDFLFFKKWVDDIGWDWFQFFTLWEMLTKKKLSLPADLMQTLQEYALKKLLPSIDFKKTYIMHYKRWHFRTKRPLFIKALFEEGHLTLPQPVLLDLLITDSDGFSGIATKENIERRLFKKIHDQVSNKDAYRKRVINNLNNYIKQDHVLEAHCSACLVYKYTEAVPILIGYFFKRTTINDVKWTLVSTIKTLTTDYLTFLPVLNSFKLIRNEWQLEILKLVLEKSNVSESNFELLVERSIRHANKDKRLQYKLIKLALKIDTPNAVDELFSYLKRSEKWGDFSDIDIDKFVSSPHYQPDKILANCFLLLPLTFSDQNDRHNSFEKFLQKTITRIGSTDERLMESALSGYESLITRHRDANPQITYFRWYEKELINEFYAQTTMYENDRVIFELLQNILA